MYEPLHHKYRPQTFADLVGQEAIATTLTNAIVSERIAPAYLFTGPRGTGKTSSARILAKSLNCLASDKPTPTPCGKCEVCRAIARSSALDVIEIDAASNTGVDNIREIIERSQFAPVQCRYKVYAIDECHMLSTAAFNALLKTLEEPPERVIFILATTDPQRVLPTIISRCQRFDYRRIPLDEMVEHLKNIADKESIDIEDDAITLVAQIANGGLRDAQSLLDQLSLLAGRVNCDRVWDLVGSVAERDLLALLKAIASDKAEAIIEQCRHLMNRGREPLVILQNLASFYLNLLIAKTAPNRPDMVAVTSSTWQELCQEAQNWHLNTILQGQQHLKESETQLKNTTQPRLWLEVTLLGLLPSAGNREIAVMPTVALSRRATQPQIATSPTKSPQEKPSETIPTPEPIQEPPSPKPEPVAVSPPPEPIAEPMKASSNGFVKQANPQLWQAVIEQLPSFTQALVRPHCHLISLKENVARVGIKTEPLLKHARGKIADLEAAFATVCRHPVKVSLEIATPNTSISSEELSDGVDEVDEVDEVEEENNISSQSTIDESPPPPPPVVPEIVQQVEVNNVRETIQVQTISSKITVISESHEVLVDLNEEYSKDELQQAAESLAKCFDGEIITSTQLIDEPQKVLPTQETTEIIVALDSASDRPLPQGRLDPSDFSDEEDIPFLRPVYSYTSWGRELWDCWELAGDR
jgi:DNA polymerase III subunit gamma/tau